MGSEVGVVAPVSSPLGRARGLEKDEVRFDVTDGIRELWLVGSYPRGGCCRGEDNERIGLVGGVRE